MLSPTPFAEHRHSLPYKRRNGGFCGSGEFAASATISYTEGVSMPGGEDVGDFYIMIVYVVVGIIASEASRKKRIKIAQKT